MDSCYLKVAPLAAFKGKDFFQSFLEVGECFVTHVWARCPDGPRPPYFDAHFCLPDGGNFVSPRLSVSRVTERRAGTPRGEH